MKSTKIGIFYQYGYIDIMINKESLLETPEALILRGASLNFNWLP